MTEQKPTRNCYIYARVSTEDQQCENQLQCINSYIESHNLNELGTVTDTMSTKHHWSKREIGSMIERAHPGEQIIVSEISRLARNTLECLEIFKKAIDAGVVIVAVKNGLRIDNSSTSKIVATVIAMAAEIERDMIRARTTEALARRKSLGLPMGRPQGATSDSKLEKSREKIAELRAKKVSKSSIAKILNCSRNTLDRALKKWEAN